LTKLIAVCYIRFMRLNKPHPLHTSLTTHFTAMSNSSLNTNNTATIQQSAFDLSLEDLQSSEAMLQYQAIEHGVYDISLDDLESSESMLHQSLVTVGKLANLSDEQIAADWLNICLAAQSTDIIDDISIDDL
jgi:hypothetical protein